MSNGMGVISLSWSEIKSWLQVTQLNLSVWERMTIKSMSEAYASELSVASKKDSVAPYTHVDDTLIANREIIATKLKSVFASFSKTKTENE